MVERDGVPTSIVEKLLDNLKDIATKLHIYEEHVDHLEDSMYDQLEKVATAIGSVGTKLNTPPRHEELMEKLIKVSEKIDEGNATQKTQITKLSNVVNTIRVAATVFGLAIIIASIVMAAGNYFVNKNTNIVQQIEELSKKVEEIKKEP